MTYLTLLLKLKSLNLHSHISFRFKLHYLKETFLNFQNVLTCYYSVSVLIAFLDLFLIICSFSRWIFKRHCSSYSHSLSLPILFQSFPFFILPTAHTFNSLKNFMILLSNTYTHATLKPQKTTNIKNVTL